MPPNAPPSRGERSISVLPPTPRYLTPAIIEFLSENSIGVTVSMDGPPDLHDKLRVFANGRGSYDIIAPRVKALIARSPDTRRLRRESR